MWAPPISKSGELTQCNLYINHYSEAVCYNSRYGHNSERNSIMSCAIKPVVHWSTLIYWYLFRDQSYWHPLSLFSLNRVQSFKTLKYFLTKTAFHASNRRYSLSEFELMKKGNWLRLVPVFLLYMHYFSKDYTYPQAFCRQGGHIMQIDILHNPDWRRALELPFEPKGALETLL